MNFAVKSASAQQKIIKTSPVNGATAVSVNTSVTVRFSAPADTASVHPYPLIDTSNNSRVKGTITFTDANQTLIFKPGEPLHSSKTYQMELSGITFFSGSQSLSGTTNFTFTTQLSSSSLTGDFSVTEIIIDVPDQGNIYKVRQPLKAHAYIKGTGTGAIFGYWYKNNMPVSPFNIIMTNGATQTLFMESSLFTNNYGRYELKMIIQAPNILTSQSIQYMVAGATSEKVSLIYPGKGAAFCKGLSSPTFSWTDIPDDLGYEITISNSKKLKGAKWIKVNYSYYKIPEEEWKKISCGTYYWAVRPIYVSGQSGELSDIFYFEINE